MGWTYTHKERGEKVFDFLIRHLYDFNHLNPDERPEIIAHSGKFHYMAFVIRVPAAYRARFPESGFKMYEPEPDGSIITMDVVLTRHNRSYHNFGWKSISEAAGPYETVPAKYLKMLSKLKDDVSSKSAQEFRARCLAVDENVKKRPKITDGVRIEFENPVIIGGRPYHVFEAMTMRYRRGRKAVTGRVWKALSNGQLVRLTNDMVSRAKILS